MCKERFADLIDGLFPFGYGMTIPSNPTVTEVKRALTVVISSSSTSAVTAAIEADGA
jgi:hypothetical protein